LFIVPRIGHLKTLAWHLFEESRRGNLICVTSNRDTLESINDYIPLKIQESVEYLDVNNAMKNKYDSVYNVSIYCDIFNLAELSLLKSNSKKMVAIDHNGEGYLLHHRREEKLPRFFWDVVETQEEFLLKEYRVMLSYLSRKVVLGSFPQLNFELNSSTSLRCKYGVPNGKRVVLFSPPQTTSRSSIKHKNLIRKIRNFWFLNNRLGEILQLVSRQADLTFNYFDYKLHFREEFPDEDWFFILKVRDKTTILEQDYDYYDLVVNDRDFFPHTTMELIKISSLIVGYSSSITVDALAQKKPSVYIEQYRGFARYGFDKWQHIRDQEVFVDRIFKNELLTYIDSSKNKSHVVNILKQVKRKILTDRVLNND